MEHRSLTTHTFVSLLPTCHLPVARLGVSQLQHRHGPVPHLDPDAHVVRVEATQEAKDCAHRSFQLWLVRGPGSKSARRLSRQRRFTPHTRSQAVPHTRPHPRRPKK